MTPTDETLKMLHDLRAALTGIHSSLDLIALQLMGQQTCDASSATSFGYMGPCVLRLEHPGPLHKDARDQVWSEPRPEPLPDMAVPETFPVNPNNSWVECTEEYLKQFGITDCCQIPRLPSNLKPVEGETPGSAEAPHLHPQQYEDDKAVRSLSGIWVSKSTEPLDPIRQSENTEIENWWRHYG